MQELNGLFVLRPEGEAELLCTSPLLHEEYQRVLRRADVLDDCIVKHLVGVVIRRDVACLDHEIHIVIRLIYRNLENEVQINFQS